MIAETNQEDVYAVLKTESIMMIGERYPSRVLWLQLYDATDSFEEDEIRQLLIEVSQHISSGNVPVGSARKFLDGKLIYYETPPSDGQTHNRVYAIFTKQIENIYSHVKKAVKAVAARGGVYSAQRFFLEMVEILDNPDKLEIYDSLSTDEALRKLNQTKLDDLDLNELGLVITHLNHSRDLDFVTLENIYFYLYETIHSLGAEEKKIVDDPDEFLDAVYVVATRYQETDNFHLALELFKHIIPVAIRNLRFDLEMACRIQISTIYKNFFPMSGEYILEQLDPVKELHLAETNNKLKEIYYCLLGHAYRDLGQEKEAVLHFKKAINVAGQETNSPIWIADAYNYLGEVDHARHYLKDASRYYLTAAAIAFSAGDLTMADQFRHNAAETEIHIANSVMHASLIHRMEMDHKDAEYRAWEGLRLLVKAYQHCLPDKYLIFKDLVENILSHARIILKLPGKQKTNREIIDTIEHELQTLLQEDFDPGDETRDLQHIAKLVEENIPLSPPTFMLLSIDGRMMTMGRITDDGWERSEIEGTLLSGILSAIMSLISEVADEKSSLRTVDAGNTQIMVEQSENIVAVLLVDRDNQEFRKRLVTLLEYIESTIGEDLKYWDGGTRIFDDIKEYAQTLLSPSIMAANMDT